MNISAGQDALERPATGSFVSVGVQAWGRLPVLFDGGFIEGTEALSQLFCPLQVLNQRHVFD